MPKFSKQNDIRQSPLLFYYGVKLLSSIIPDGALYLQPRAYFPLRQRFAAVSYFRQNSRQSICQYTTLSGFVDFSVLMHKL